MLEENMKAEELTDAHEQGGWPEVEAQLEHKPLLEAIHELTVLMSHLRYMKKDLPGVAKVADRAQSLVALSNDPEVLSAWKQICYNRASFFWRGWGDEDVEITREMEAEAEPFAQKNFDLAVRLNKGAIAMGRAEWLIGAFQWSNNDRAGARLRFETAAGLLETSDSREHMMMLAYAGHLAGEDINPILNELSDIDKPYADQVRRAIEVLG